MTRIAVALCTAAALISCARSYPGLGSSTEAPTGQPFHLPQGVTVQGRIAGGETPECTTSTPPLGTGSFVEICAVLHNSNPTPVTLVIPGGLIFISKSLGTQNGIVIQEQTIVLPPRQVTVLRLPQYCLNRDRAGSSSDDTFDIGPVTDNAGLREIVDLVRGKTVDGMGITVVQTAVWEVTDDSGRLTEEQRAALRGL